jgi:large subunit ribosomal protein L4
MALAAKIRDGEVALIDNLSFTAPKTKEMAGILKSLKLGPSVLVTIDQYDENVYKSVRNIAQVAVSPVAELNALCVLKPRRVLMTKAALDSFRKRTSEINPKARSQSA